MKMLSALECSSQAIMKQDQSIEDEERASCTPKLTSGLMKKFVLIISVFMLLYLRMLICHFRTYSFRGWSYSHLLLQTPS